MLIDRLRVGLTGSQIGSGVATHYALPNHNGQAALSTWWSGCAAHMPSNVFINVPPDGDTIEVETGLLQNVWSDGVTHTYTGGQGGAHAAGVGVCITWLTAGIVNGKRIRGRTFIVPLGGSRFDTDGTILDNTLSGIREATNTLLGAMDDGLMIYHRPVGEAQGTAHAVTGFRLPDRVSSLKSRR